MAELHTFSGLLQHIYFTLAMPLTHKEHTQRLSSIASPSQNRPPARGLNMLLHGYMLQMPTILQQNQGPQWLVTLNTEFTLDSHSSHPQY